MGMTFETLGGYVVEKQFVSSDYVEGYDAGYLRALSDVMQFVSGFDGVSLTKKNVLSVAMQLRLKQKTEGAE